MSMNEVLDELLHSWTKREEMSQLISIVHINQLQQHFNANNFYHFFNSFNYPSAWPYWQDKPVNPATGRRGASETKKLTRITSCLSLYPCTRCSCCLGWGFSTGLSLILVGKKLLRFWNSINNSCFWEDVNLGRWQFGEMAIWGDGNLGRWQFGEMGTYIPP